MGAVGRWTGVLVFVCAFCGALGDDGDINCSDPTITNTTQYFCALENWTEEYVHPKIGQKGWVLISVYHAFVTVGPKLEKKYKWWGVEQRAAALLDAAKLARLVGQNMLVYSCYYDAKHQYFLKNDYFTHALSLIMFDMVILFGCQAIIKKLLTDYVWPEDTKSKSIAGRQPKDLKKPNPGSESEDRTSAKDEAQSWGGCFTGGAAADDRNNKLWDMATVYVLPNVPPLRMTFIWLSQTVLFGLYFLVMNEVSKQTRADGSTLVWLMGVLVMCTMGDQQAGESFDFIGWARVASTYQHHYPVARFHMAWRCFFDWSVNSVYRQILLATTAILLSTEGPIDFVKDVLAIVFISTLDDPNDDQSTSSKTMLFNHERNYYVKDDEMKKADYNVDNFADAVTCDELASYFWQAIDYHWRRIREDEEGVPLEPNQALGDHQAAQCVMARETDKYDAKPTQLEVAKLYKQLQALEARMTPLHEPLLSQVTV